MHKIILITALLVFSYISGSLQALVQFADSSCAQAAKVALNGQTLYSGCNMLRVDFSKLPGLNVRFNNDKSRDYTNPLLPYSEGVSAAGTGVVGVPASSALEQFAPSTSQK